VKNAEHSTVLVDFRVIAYLEQEERSRIANENATKEYSQCDMPMPWMEANEMRCHDISFSIGLKLKH